MSKHTPGPWYEPHICDPDIRCNCTYVLSEKYAGSICDISVDNGKAISQGGNDSPPLEEAIANAKLIAAAPELLELLELSLPYLKDAAKTDGHAFAIYNKVAKTIKRFQ